MGPGFTVTSAVFWDPVPSEYKKSATLKIKMSTYGTTHLRPVAGTVETSSLYFVPKCGTTHLSPVAGTVQTSSLYFVPTNRNVPVITIET